MNTIFLVLAAIAAMIEWIAVGKRCRIVEFFAKPAVMIILLAWLIRSGSLQQDQPLWFTIGLFFSLLGDIFLLIPQERIGFPLGLTAFFLTQLCFIRTFQSANFLHGIYSLILAGVILLLFGWLGWRLMRSLITKGMQLFIIPLSLYMLAVAAMLFSALSLNFQPDWNSTPALLISSGAIAFAASDTILAWNKFIAPVRNGRVLLMIAYHFGQIALVLGITRQFL